MSARMITAVWFGLLAAVLAVPFCLALLFSIADWSLKFSVCTVLLEGIIPIAIAAFMGSSLGIELCREGAVLSWQRAFFVGVKIALASAVRWVAITLLFTFILGLVTDARRIGGTPVFLAIFSLPITALLAGGGAVVLRMLVVKRIISVKEQKDDREKSSVSLV